MNFCVTNARLRQCVFEGNVESEQISQRKIAVECAIDSKIVFECVCVKKYVIYFSVKDCG